MRRGSPVTWEQVRVGLLILVALAVLSAAVFLVGNTGNVFGTRYRVVMLVRSAAGIVPGAAVQLAGQTVGQVDRIRLIPPETRPEDGQTVEIWLAVDDGVREQIRADSRAQVRTQGLLGDKLIDISPGTADARVLSEGDTLVAASSVDYDALIAEGAGAVGELLVVTRNLSELTGDLLEGRGTLGMLVTDEALYDRVTSLAGRLDSVLVAVADPDGPLLRMLADDSLYAALRSATLGLDRVVSSVARGEGSLGRLVTSDSLYGDLRSSVSRMDSLLAGLEAGEGAAGRLLEDDRLYEELLKTVVDLNSLLEAVRQDPARYVPPVSVF